LPVRLKRIDDLGRVRVARVELGGRLIAATVPDGLSVAGEEAGLTFDPRHVHIYADGHLLAGEPVTIAAA
jgi:glycerol transport system ATP-binding protein